MASHLVDSNPKALFNYQAFFDKVVTIIADRHVGWEANCHSRDLGGKFLLATGLPGYVAEEQLKGCDPDGPDVRFV